MKDFKEYVLEEKSSRLNVLALLCTLKRGDNVKKSNTKRFLDVVTDKLAVEANVETFVISDLDITQSNNQHPREPDMENLYVKMENADIIVFGTSVMWGSVSSLAQKVLERMTAYHSYEFGVKPLMSDKIFGAVITGGSDGYHPVRQHMMSIANFLRMIVVPDCIKWVFREDRNNSKLIEENATLMVENLLKYAKETLHLRKVRNTGTLSLLYKPKSFPSRSYKLG